MLEGLVAHCVTQWQRRLSRPLHAASMADFLGGFFPPAPAGKAPLQPYQRAQRRPRYSPAQLAEQYTSSSAAQLAATQGVPTSRRGLCKGHGSTGGLYPTHRAPSCERCRATGQGVTNCCRCGHTGHPKAGAPTRTSRDQACGGCRRRSGSPWPETCMAGCGGGVSRGTRTCRLLHRRWPMGAPTGEGRVGEGSEHQRRAHGRSPAPTEAPQSSQGRGGGAQPEDHTPRPPSPDPGTSAPPSTFLPPA